jgi:UDP-N-acetylmuramyl pentapeptide phosphotransferase/UDP-N-acetylglucosamine-1-phosphate transferase
MPTAALLVAFVISFIGIRVLLRALAHVALDRPNYRSLHERPVPRTGGIAILLGVATSLAFGAAPLWLPMALAAALAVLSFLDDVRGMPAWVRLLGHVSACAVLAWFFLSPMNLLELALVACGVAWMTNLYNFMDGSDGLAGGMSVIGFAAYAAAAWLAGESALAVLSLALVGGSAAFLLHNFHPARVFLGDVGSVPLGFLAGALGVVGWRNDAWPLWFPLLVFGPFVGDATLTLARRLLRGERVWRAHREHYYQRMVRMGLGHRGTAAVGYAAMAACAGAALFGRDKDPATQAALFGAASALLAAMAIWVDVRWGRFRKQAGVSG